MAQPTNGVIATPHKLATASGQRMYGLGGSAIDASIAAAAVLAVVYPHMTSLGGDSWSLVRTDKGKILAVNGTGAYPRAASVAELRARFGNTMPLFGPLSVPVPGAVKAWEALHQQGGRLDWSELFRDALNLAENGVPVAAALGRDLKSLGPELVEDPGLRSIFFDSSGQPLGEGDQLVQPQLAQTLRALSSGGPEALYSGPLAARYVSALNRMGSSITEDDMRLQTAVVSDTMTVALPGAVVHTAPPNSQGFTLLQMLSVLQEAETETPIIDSDPAFGAALFSLSNAERELHLADPEAGSIEINTVLTATYIKGLADRVRARDFPEAPGKPRANGDTVAIAALDDAGIAVSSLHSIFYAFGARVLEPETGILLQNRATSFSLHPDHPAALVPGTRPPSTLLPVMLDHRNGDVSAVATMGGRSQGQIQVQLIERLLAGAGPQDVVSAPRLVVGAFGPQLENSVVAESACGEGVISSLRDEGWLVSVTEGFDDRCGHSQIATNGGGTLLAGTDPRADAGVSPS